MNSGESASADDDEVAFAAVQNCREVGTQSERVCFGKALGDDDLIGFSGLGHPARAHVKPVEDGLPAVRQRNELSGCGLGELRDIEQRQLGDAAVHGGDAGDFRNPVEERLGRTSQQSKHIGELVSLVVGRARLLQGSLGADG